jgi:hypothetical protein
LTWHFWSVNILSREVPGEEEVNNMPRGRTSPGGAVPLLGRATHGCSGLEPPTPSIFVPTCSAFPKNAYIHTPWTITIRGSGETRNTEIEAIPAKIGGGKCCRSRPQSLIHPLWRQHHHHRHEEGVVHLFTMGLWR